MATLFDAQERASILNRIAKLKPGARPLWGRMTASEMVCHLIAAVRSGISELPGEPEVVPRGPMSRFPLNWLVIHVLPWPKGKIQGPPELLDTAPTTWERDLAELSTLVERAGSRGPGASWPPTQVFGRISGKTWGVLLRKHTDHHLRQFGV